MQSGSNQCLKLPREGYTHGELGLLPLWSSRAMVRCIRLRGCHVRAGGRCREIRLSGPLFMLYTPLKHRARCHGFKFSRSNVGTRYAAHPLLVDAPPAMQQRSTIPPICPRNSRRLYVEARKGGWFRTLFCAVSLLAFHRSARNRMFPLRVPFATSIFQCLRVYSDVVRFCCFAILNSFFVTCENYRRFTES